VHRFINFCESELISPRERLFLYIPPTGRYRIHTRIRSQVKNSGDDLPSILGLFSLVGIVMRLPILHQEVYLSTLTVHIDPRYSFRAFTSLLDLDGWEVPVVRAIGESYWSSRAISSFVSLKLEKSFN
jgi:hypothetical protein